MPVSDEEKAAKARDAALQGALGCYEGPGVAGLSCQGSGQAAGDALDLAAAHELFAAQVVSRVGVP